VSYPPYDEGSQQPPPPPGPYPGQQPPPYPPPGQQGYPPPYPPPGQQGYPPPPYPSYQPGYQPYGPQQQDHPQATLAMILGIVGVVVCQLIAPFALVIGRRAMNEIDASGGTLGGRGMAQAGFILGIIGTIFLVLFLLYIVFVVIILGAGIAGSS
jgi:Domain of unknown function (DUF4190)